jgi:hypothetical protein
VGKNVIITGSTGMVGKGVLLECLESEHVDSVLVINRETVNVQHPKLKEIIHKNFYNLESIKHELKGYHACFYCLGISSVGMKEDEYATITFDITKHFADIMYEQSPNANFIYVSGAGTDSTEKGRIMWARVKGKTENMILNKGFQDAYAFRPGAILPVKGVKSKTGWYNFIYEIIKPINPILLKSKSVTTTSKIGLAMIDVVLNPQDLKHLENLDINRIANNI